MLALRAGTNPQALITTTPRRVPVLRRILAEATTVQTTDTTYANQAHLPPEFIAQIVGLYENTRLGRQEIHAEFLDTTDGVWFTRFDPSRHLSAQAEYDPMYHVRCAIDAGTSRHTAAVFFQVRHHNGLAPPRVTVFGDYHALDVVSRKNALAIKELADQLPCHGKIDLVRLDPAASARSSLGPGGLLRVRAGVRLADSSPGGRATWSWTGSIPSTCSWNAATYDPPPVLAAEGRFPNILPAAPRRRVGGLPGRWPSGGRLDRRLRGGVRDAFPEAWCRGPTATCLCFACPRDALWQRVGGCDRGNLLLLHGWRRLLRLFLRWRPGTSSRARHAHFRNSDSAYHDRVELRRSARRRSTKPPRIE